MKQLDPDLETRIRALAGRCSDAVVARAVGCSPGTVCRVRRLAGIPPWRAAAPELAWPEERLGLVGAMPDGQLAARWNVSRAAVQAKRIELGRPAADGSVTTIYLSPALRTKLGSESDAALAKRYRVSVAAVRLARLRAGIATTRHVHQVEWTPEMLAELPTTPTGVFCRKHRVSNRTVAIKRSELGCPSPRPARSGRWTAEMLALLGTASDATLARRWGMSEDAVRKRRARLGIAAHGSSTRDGAA